MRVRRWVGVAFLLRISGQQPNGSAATVFHGDLGIFRAFRVVLTSLLVPVVVLRAQVADTFNPSVSQTVYALAVQPDGKVLIGGLSGLKRVAWDGTADPSFSSSAAGTVYCIAIQPDGKLMVGGHFSTLAGQSRTNLGRLNPDGALDPTFTASANGTVYTMALQTDGQVVVGGSFSLMAGQAATNVGRLNGDGAFDPGFNGAANGVVNTIAVQSDGSILIGGNFTAVGANSITNLARLLPSGDVDGSFGQNANGVVNCLAVQADGKVLLGGSFTTVGSQLCSRVGRLNADGSLDPTFSAAADNSVLALAVQADNRILVAGWFGLLDKQARAGLGRLNPDGTLDASFDAQLIGGSLYPQSAPSVYSTALQSDGRLLIGGSFTKIGGSPRSNLGRLNFVTFQSASLGYDGAKLNWLQPGYGPQFSRATFDTSTNGTDWITLGAGRNFSNLWQVSVPSLPNNTSVRARGFVTSGQNNGSTWFAESSAGPPAIEVQPAGTAVKAGSIAGYAVQAAGTPPLNFKWFKNGLALADVGNARGTRTSTLSLSNILSADAGTYWVSVSNSLGATTSVAANLIVQGDPAFKTQPGNRTNDATTTAAFSVSVVGTTPLTYQWLKGGSNLNDGSNVSGSLTPTLTLTNVSLADVGMYCVVISNSIGSATSALAFLSVNDPVILGQPAGLLSSVGQTVSFSAGASGTSPIGYQWRKNGVPISGQSAVSLTLTNIQQSDAANYDVLVTNAVGSATSKIATLTINFSFPDTFNPAPNSVVYALATQTDGRIVVGGSFSSIAGQPRNNLARLNTDGTLDLGFNPGADGGIYSLAVQCDGKILVGGIFSTVGGRSCSYLARLNADGTPDWSFNPGADGWVYSIAMQPDGKVIVGGSFSTLAEQPRNSIGRFNADGTLDATFNPGATSGVYSLAIQPDGKIVVGGWYSSLGGAARSGIGRLNPDGTLDTGFNPSANPWVWALALQADGKVLVGGWLSTLGGQARANIGRLNQDGTLDTAFNPGASGQVYCLAVQTDGRILVGGAFSTLAGQGRAYIGRLNPDGTLDPTFNPGAGGSVYGLGLQTDGSVVACGAFSSLGGQSRANLGRLTNTDTGAQTLSVDRASITWTRAGAEPEIASAVFEVSTNGGDWFKAGQPQRTTNGWQSTDLNLPTNATIRVRGFMTGGQYNGSSWFTEMDSGPFAISPQPESIISMPYTSVEFSVGVVQGTPTGFQWLKNGTNLSDAGNIFGSRSSTLIVSNVSESDTGAYSIIVSNSSGSLLSKTASLALIDPVITNQPTSASLNAGSTANLTVGALGTSPPSYQWSRNGLPLADTAGLSGSSSATLHLSNALALNSGSYSVVVTNAFGAATSSIAVLTVHDPAITIQPQSQTATAGQTVSLAVAAAGTPPLFYQWRENGLTLTNAQSAVLVLTNVQQTDVATYDVVVASPSGSLVSDGATLTLSGPPVPVGCDSFTAAPGGVARPAITAMTVLPSGDILMGGSFATLNGQPVANLARLSHEGTLDPRFSPSTDGSVLALLVQTNGKVTVGGTFHVLCGQARNHLGRLNADGSLDTTFNPGFSASVYALALQPDGQILVGGMDTVRRLTLSGSWDTNLNVSVTSSPLTPSVNSLAVQADGKILVGGFFSAVAGQSRTSLARINADGTLDTSFNPYIYAWGGTWNAAKVESVVVQADGRILVGGWFSSPFHNLGRLKADGSFDAGLSGGTDDYVESLTVQADGGVLIAGYFRTLAGHPCSGLGRVTSAGSFDPSFTPAPDGSVNCLAVEPDGGVLVAGSFNTLAGVPRSGSGRLSNSIPALQTLGCDDTSVFWQRAGSAPELASADFAFSTNGTDWIALGPAVHAGSRWLYTGVCLPTNYAFRARGLTSSGQHNGSGSYLEMVGGAPGISGQPLNQTNKAGSTAVFAVQAGGTEQLDYQWLKNGTPLADSGKVSGTRTPELTLRGLLGPDAGAYRVTITNALGAVTSVTTYLAVIDPVIVGQPSGQTVKAGQDVTLTVTAVGTTPLTYAWRKDGTNVLGASNASLTLSNVQPAGAGNYDVVVTNTFGRTTSDVALVTFQITAGKFPATADSTVLAIAVQTDGRILVGGAFTSLCGQSRSYLGRLNGDGTFDYTFLSSPQFAVNSLAVQTNGAILVGGGFSTNLARLSAYGELDTTFSAGANGTVYDVALQPDGKVILVGLFTKLNGQTQSYLGRLNPNGTLDTAFAPSANSWIYCVTLQTDGRILLGGAFTNLCGQPRSHIGRLNSNGTLDASFAPSASGDVYDIAGQSDNRLLVAGAFTNLCGSIRNRIGRLYPDGTLDASFNPNASGSVLCLALQTDGKIVVGGSFASLGTETLNGLGRLNADGTLDTAFRPLPGNSSSVGAAVLQPDGKLLVGGTFSSIGGQTVLNLARLNNTSSSQTVAFDGMTLKLVRSGTAPEVWRVTFEASTDNASWKDLGPAVRATGGWQLPNLTLPLGATIRARGFMSGRRESWFVESLLAVDPDTAPIIVTGDGTAGFGTGQFGFKVHALAGQNVVVEATTDFVNWTTVQTNLYTGLSDLVFSDARSGFFPYRFYRAGLYVGTLPAPRIRAGAGFVGPKEGPFAFDVSGVPGQTVIVEVSTNLTAWTPQATNILKEDQFYFSDTDSTNHTSCFYRLRLQEGSFPRGGP